MIFTQRPRVVILGGGFGGLYAGLSLKNIPVQITLIDERNHHLFQPLLYQVATASLNPSDIAIPIRSIFRFQKNIKVILAKANRIDPVQKKVMLDNGEIEYDYLIVSTGASHSYFGHDDWAPYAPALKTVEDALEIRKRILLAYEAAERESDLKAREAWLTFVIVGGGPTGVELAGAMAEISRHTLTDEFRNIDPRKARILLYEGYDRVLSTYPKELSDRALQQLEKLGVEVHTGKQVTQIDVQGVLIGDERVSARTVIWAAGVLASPIARSLGVPLDRAGRVLVNEDLTVPGYPNIFVIGDLAALKQDGEPIPGVAPAAMQEAHQAVRNIALSLKGKPLQKFRYNDKGMLAVIGRSAAIAHIGKLKLSGFIAWFVWLFIHIFFLIGFRNRFLVIFQWAWAYFSYDRGARLITGNTKSLLSRDTPSSS